MRKNGMQPVHPGEILLEEFMKPSDPPINATTLAKALEVPANRITAIIKGQRGITGDTEVRLAAFFNGTAEFWMSLQETYELRLAAIGEIATAPEPSPGPLDRQASLAEMERYFAHLEQALGTIDFLKGRSSRVIMLRLRRMYLRAQPSLRELNILHGILSEAERQSRVGAQPAAPESTWASGTTVNCPKEPPALDSLMPPVSGRRSVSPSSSMA